MKNFIKNKKIYLFIFCLLSIFAIAFKALALELSWPASPVSHIILTDSTTLPKLVQYFYEWMIALGGLAAFISLIIAGFQYLTSVGNETAMREAKDRIQSAIFGLILLFGSWLILNTINPQLTTLRTPPGISSGLTKLECDIDADCRTGYKCTDPNPGDGTKAGVCTIKEKKQVTCVQAQIFKGTEYSGESVWIKVNETREYPSKSVKVYADPSKVKDYAPQANPIIENGLADCCSEDAYKNGYYGCGCNLQVFAGGGFLGWGCGDMEAIVLGCEENIPQYTDRPIKCAKLISSSW
jgi:hypothetical protein